MISEEYVVARRALLDALEALNAHLDALILVGAQAIYVHTGAASLAVAEYTTDADVAIDPRSLGPAPEISAAMRSANFYPGQRAGQDLVGVWSSSRLIRGVPATVNVDLLVPDSLGGSGRRAARIPPHERGSILKVHGLEAALVDNLPERIGSLEDGDLREFVLRIAGPAALLISKTIKLSERTTAAAEGTGRDDRVKPKDALDVLRILQAVPMQRLADDLFRLAGDSIAANVSAEALRQLPQLFEKADSLGSSLAATAAAPEPAEVIAASCSALCIELMTALESRGLRSA